MVCGYLLRDCDVLTLHILLLEVCVWSVVEIWLNPERSVLRSGYMDTKYCAKYENGSFHLIN